jgi:pSer/pThr/pTyr-binding forkhead associated (FHA) protein
MPEGLLTIFKFLFLAVLYLFLYRVVRVIYVELKHPVSVAAPGGAAAAPPVASARSDRAKRGGGPTLEIIEPASRAGERFPVDDELSVGRAGGCGVVLVEDTFVSQVHARVFRRGRQMYVEDLGSRNGTFVDGERITEPTRINRGTRVQFGQTVTEVAR